MKRMIKVSMPEISSKHVYSGMASMKKSFTNIIDIFRKYVLNGKHL